LWQQARAGSLAFNGLGEGNNGWRLIPGPFWRYGFDFRHVHCFLLFIDGTDMHLEREGKKEDEKKGRDRESF